MSHNHVNLIPKNIVLSIFKQNKIYKSHCHITF